jgi:hypothetical protein
MGWLSLFTHKMTWYHSATINRGRLAALVLPILPPWAHRLLSAAVSPRQALKDRLCICWHHMHHMHHMCWDHMNSNVLMSQCRYNVEMEVVCVDPGLFVPLDL